MNTRYSKKTKKQKESQLIKKIKYYLWYEKKASPKLMITNSEAVKLFFELEGITKDKQRGRADFIIHLEETKKYPVLNNRCIRPRKYSRSKYVNYLQSSEWQKKRQDVFNDRGRICERCNEDLSNKRADVHHKTYKSLFNERLEDLEVLCRPCHNKEHKGDKRNKRNPKKKKSLSLSQKYKMLETKKGRDKLRKMGYDLTKG